MKCTLTLFAVLQKRVKGNLKLNDKLIKARASVTVNNTADIGYNKTLKVL